ncbi:hypothetical protein [Clostridium kluyveri]|uniref:hypothetical protein n=1 Tax=Clostridium kluyveri TaxID=1534 RepID=UPI002246FBDD|nr:hypothetical protein [Clostridium kluyveri]UZQ49113.1 hypothetical protein OP486_14240 [Clostridium kluyveri]
MLNELEVSSLEEIRQNASGEIIELSGWNSKPFYAKVKRVSLLDLVSEGIIPNSLLAAAEQVFQVKGAKKNNTEELNFKENAKIFDIIAKTVLVEPTYEDLLSIDVKLTDNQRMELFYYAQSGVKGLERFRAEQERLENSGLVGKIPQTAERDNTSK